MYYGLTKDRSYWPEGGLMLISLGNRSKDNVLTIKKNSKRK